MADTAHKATDKKLEEIEKQLTQIYSRAQGEIGAKWKEYMRKADEKLGTLQKEYEEAKKSGDADAIKKAAEALKRAKRQATFYNQRFKDLTDKYAKELLNVNKTALAYINNELPDIYSLNYNALDGQIKGYSFTLTDAETVKNLATEDKTLLPYKVVDGKKDVRWNTAKVNSEVLQGILQGESMNKIADRLQKVTEMNKQSAIRNARTSVTSAECKGRQDSYLRAKDEGIDIKKEWLATLDGRTRHSHALLDGKKAEVDKPFESELGKIMYPGDPEARPANVYNCRCTTIADVGQKRSESRIARDSNGKSVLVDNMTYEEWYKWKTGKPFVVVAEEFNSEKVKYAMGDKYQHFVELLNEAKTKSLFQKFSNEVKTIIKTGGDSYYSSAQDAVFFRYDNSEGVNQFGIFAHEMGHSFDARVAKNISLSFGEVDLINEKCKIGSGITKTIAKKASSSDDFLSAMRADKKTLRVYMTSLAERNRIKSDLLSIGNATSGVQDAMDGFFGTQSMKGSGMLPWGHGNAYYNRFYNKKIKTFGLDKQLKEIYEESGFDASNQTKVKQISRDYETASELWANITSAYTVGGAELEAMKKYMPNSCKIYEEILGRLGK